MIHNCSGSSLRSNKESFQTLLIFCDGQTHFFVLFLQQPYCFSYNHFNWNRLWAPCILLFLIRNNVIIFYFVVYFSFGLPNYLCTINSIVILHVFPAVLFTHQGWTWVAWECFMLSSYFHPRCVGALAIQKAPHFHKMKWLSTVSYKP